MWFLKRSSVSSWVNQSHISDLSLWCPAAFCLTSSQFKYCVFSDLWILFYLCVLHSATLYCSKSVTIICSFWWKYLSCWAESLWVFLFFWLCRNIDGFSFVYSIIEHPLWLQEFRGMLYHLPFHVQHSQSDLSPMTLILKMGSYALLGSYYSKQSFGHFLFMCVAGYEFQFCVHVCPLILFFI